MDETNSSNKQASGKVRILSILFVVLCMIVSILTLRMQQKEVPFSLGDFSDVSVEAMEKQYEKEGDTYTLIELLKVLCYQAEVEHDNKIKEKIRLYGQELFSRAKAETIDLSEIGEEDPLLLELLKMIRKYGAK